MKFELLIVFDMSLEQDINDIQIYLIDALVEVLEDNQNDINDIVMDSIIHINHRRQVNTNTPFVGNNIIGVTLDLPENIANLESVITGFVAALQDSPPIFHVVKFEDSLLQSYLAKRAVEIFDIEMQLRRAISLIYLNTYQLQNPFDLLKEEQVRPNPRGGLEEMKKVGENQFFRLSFSDYIRLNQSSPLTVAGIIQLIDTSDGYDSFREKILHLDPIQDEHDAAFLSSLKQIMDPIERMRNCVAHNRHPIEDLPKDYKDALTKLRELLNDYFARWEVQE